MVQNRHRDCLVACLEIDAPDADGTAALEQPNIGGLEADCLAIAGRHDDVVIFGTGAHPDNPVALVEFHGDLAVRFDVGEVAHRVAPHMPAGGREHDLQILPIRLVLGQRQHVLNDLALGQRQQVLHRPAAGMGAGDGNAIGLHLVDLTAVREEQHRGVGVNDEDPADEILLARCHAGPALAAAPLRPIGGKRHPLDVAGVADGDDHVLALDQVLLVVLELDLLDLRAPRRREFLAHLDQLVAQDAEQPFAAGQDAEIVGDLVAELLQLGTDLFTAERRQPVEAEIEDAAGLGFGQLIASIHHLMARLVDQAHQVLDALGRPAARHQQAACRGRVGRAADQDDHLVDIGDGDRQPDQQMRAVPCLVQQIPGAPGDDFLAEGDEGGDQVAQVHQLRPPAGQRQHVDAEGGLQRREAIELVEHHLGHGIAPQLDHHADAVPVRLVANLADAFDASVAHGIGDLLDHPRLVHLIGNLGDDDRGAVLADLFEFDLAAHHDRAAAGVERRADAGPPEDQGASREIRPDDEFHQLVDRQGGIVDKGAAGVDHLAQIVRRHVGGHADGDAAGAVDQQVGEAGRQDDRLLDRAVVVRLEIDRVLVDVVQQRLGRLAHADFRVPHGGRRVVVHGAEIALAVEQRQPHGKVLRHAHHGVIDRRIAMRVIAAHDGADDIGRFPVRLVGAVAVLMHRVEDAAMHRFQAVTRIRQRPADDDAHGVIEVGALHLLFDGHRCDVAIRRPRRRRRGYIGQIRCPSGVWSGEFPRVGRGRVTAPESCNRRPWPTTRYAYLNT